MGDTAIAKALTEAYQRADVRSLPAAEARIVIFSDHHKGVRDGADDFLRCEPAYSAALAWYLEEGYELHVLGDAEELWENDPAPVLATGTGSPEVLALEARFHRSQRYERFFGNHDDLWASTGPVAKHLHATFPGLRVREAMKLHLQRTGAPDASWCSSTGTRARSTAIALAASLACSCASSGDPSSASRATPA